MKQIIVTVGREHGSGGKYIAEQIAKQLGIAFYDKELLLASVFNAEDAARYDEKPVHLLWSRRIRSLPTAASRSSCSAGARIMCCAPTRTPCTCSSPERPT